MTSDFTNSEMRLAAIEYLPCQLWVNSMKFAGVTERKRVLGELMRCLRTSKSKRCQVFNTLLQTSLRKLLDILSIYNERCWAFKSLKGDLRLRQQTR